MKQFRAFYRTPTEAEKKGVAEMAEKRRKEKGHSTSEQKNGGAIATTLAADVAYEPVQGIGDAAAWSVSEHRLVVLKGCATFKVEALVSRDQTANLARKLAGEVLAKCR